MCARMQGLIKHFLTLIYRFPFYKCRILAGKGDTEPPVPFRKDKTGVTDVGTIALPMFFSLLFFHYSSANRIISHYSSDTLYNAPVCTSPPDVGVYKKGVCNRAL